MEERKVELNKFQNSIWELVQICRDGGIGNQGGYLSFEESIDIDNLMESAYISISCEDILRLRIDENDEFYVSEYEEYYAGCIPSISFDSEEEFLCDMKTKMEQSLVVPHEPLVKSWVAICGDKVYLCGVFHHIVTDGYGVAKILSDAMEIYDLDVIGKEEYVAEKRSLPIGYFSQQFPDKDKIESLCEKATFCNKADRLSEREWIIKQPATKKNAKEHTWEIKESMYEAIKAYERKHEVFADAMFSAAIAVFVNWVTGSNYSVIEKTQLNRNKNQLQMAGMFANALPQVISVDEYTLFSELCKDIASENFKLMKQASCSKSELMDYCGWKGQITDISLSYNNHKFTPKLCHGARNDVFCGYQEMPLRIQVYEKEDSFLVQMQYQTEVYSEYEIEQYSIALEYIMRQICVRDCMNKDIKIGEIDNLSRVSGKYEAKEEFLSTVIESFFERVDKNPYEMAFIYEQDGHLKKMDYKIAGDCVCAIATYLKKNGLERGDILGIHMKRGVLMPLTMLAAFLVEAAILPISIYESVAQCKNLYEKCKLVIDDSFVKGEGEVILEAKGQLPTVEEQCLYHSPKDIAYYIQTSGTTGDPKLVAITHYALSVRLNWHRKIFGKTGVFMQKTRNTFDVAMWELLYPASVGATLYILPERKELDMSYIADKIEELSVTHIHFVPSVLELFIESDKWEQLYSLKYLISSGEVLKAASVASLKENRPGLKVYNLYGPAECTIDVTAHECTGKEEDVPIGAVADRTTITIRNKYDKLVPKGYGGEIVIEGDLVGEGYYQNETTEGGYFTDNGKKCYRTGDYGWFDEHDELHYVGRKDAQKKLRGMRVDLGRLENKALESRYLVHAMADIEDNHLILYYQKKKELAEDIDLEQVLSDYLKNELPYHYLPSDYYEVDDFSIAESGKLNRKFMIEQRRNKLRKDSIIDTTEESSQCGEYSSIKEILEEELGREVGLYDNLFEIGMDSLNVIKITTKLQSIGYNVSSSDIYERPTLYNLMNLSRKQDILYVKRDDTRKLLIAIPYAGGKVESMSALLGSNLDSDIVVPDLEIIGKRTGENVRDMYKYIYDLICERVERESQEVTVLGYCVGAAFAMGLYEYMQHMDIRVGNLVFCGALPVNSFNKQGEIVSIWDYVPDNVVNTSLKLLGMGQKMSREKTELFKKEVRMSAKLLKSRKKKVSVPRDKQLVLIYGCNDKLTLGWYKKYKNWSNYISGKIHVKCIKDCGHYDLLR